MTKTLTLPAYLVANAASLFGNAAIAIVLPWLVLERTGDPALAGLVTAISAAPGAIAAFTGGWLIDRIGRRRMAVLSDVGSALSVSGLAIVDQIFGLSVTWFIALGVFGALFDAPGLTARATLLKNVSDTSGMSLEKISGLQGALYGLAYLAGPAVAGGLLAILPTIQVVWITAACSALAALAIAIMPLNPQVMEPHEDDSPLAGFSYVRRSRPLTVLLISQLASTILVAPLLSIILPAHFNAMNAPTLLGLSLSGYAVGMALGSMFFGWGFATRQWLAWMICQACFVIFALLVAPLTGFWLIAIGMCIAGIGGGFLQPIGNVVLTNGVPEALRGRVFAVYSTLSLVGAPVGLGAMTAVVGSAGIGVTAWVMTGGWVMLAIYCLFAPGMKEFLTKSSEEPVADHQTAG